MSERELVQMMEFADEQVQRIFKVTQRIHPMWHMVTSAGETKIMPTPSAQDKDTAERLVRRIFELLDVVRYVFIGEAWTAEVMDEDLPKVEAELQRAGNLENYPGRNEVVQLQGEDRDCGQLVWWRAITRPKIGPARLGPLEKDCFRVSSGRMVGLLPKAKATQH